MSMKMPIPPGFDPSLSVRVLALKHGVSAGTVYRWKRRVGVPAGRRGPPNGVRKTSLAWLVTPQEWAMGCSHVGKLLGISRQAAWVVRNRLKSQGHLPEEGQEASPS